MTGLVQYALEPQVVELRQLAVPELGEDDVLLRVGAVSVCGSDVHQYHNKQSWPVKVPVVLGHEFGGEVARVGARVREFKEGDRVASRRRRLRSAASASTAAPASTTSVRSAPASATAPTAGWRSSRGCPRAACTTSPTHCPSRGRRSPSPAASDTTPSRSRAASGPPVAQERLLRLPDGLVRIMLKRAYADGTVAVDMDPLSLRCRLATSVPPPRFHTVKYAGVLAPASRWRARIAPTPPVDPAASADEPEPPRRVGGYRPWAELLARTFAVDVLTCARCHGRMRLLAMVTDLASVARYLAATGEATEVPRRSPGHGPPYGKSLVLRGKALGDEDGWSGGDDSA